MSAGSWLIKLVLDLSLVKNRLGSLQLDLGINQKKISPWALKMSSRHPIHTEKDSGSSRSAIAYLLHPAPY